MADSRPPLPQRLRRRQRPVPRRALAALDGVHRRRRDGLGRRARGPGQRRHLRGPLCSVRTMTWDLERAYRDHLTAGDLAVLADVGAGRSLTNVLSSPELERIVFGPDADPRRAVSPFLTFAVAVHRVADDLAHAAYINEWIGPGQRVPVFAVEPLRRLLTDPARRLFLIQ